MVKMKNLWEYGIVVAFQDCPLYMILDKVFTLLLNLLEKKQIVDYQFRELYSY